MSLPARERGLKQITLSPAASSGRVAPRAGAWIETIAFLYSVPNSGVAPPRAERGLKPMPACKYCREAKSLPARERGLKLFIRCTRTKICRLAPPARERGLKQD